MSKEKLELACWIARSIFDRGLGPGTTGNLSFIQNGTLYITGGGTCFGRLRPEDFSAVELPAMKWTGPKPSKELPLHAAVYRHDPNVSAVIHIHSTYATLWSCLPHEKEADCVPQYTPYLKMKLGTVGLIPYAKPGSQELFDSFDAHIDASDGWLLRNHGLVVGGKDLMDAFACAEELEESCKVAWMLKNTGASILE